MDNIMGNFLTLAGIIVDGIVAYFIWLQAKACKKADKKEGFEMSLELTRFYIKDIIPKMNGVVPFISKLPCVKEYMSKTKNGVIEEFTRQEFEKLYTCDDTKKFIENVFIKECDAMGGNIAKGITVVNGIGSLLNDMEYFSMHFISCVATDDVVYDSLHQTFVDGVRMLYPFICYNNDENSPHRKYYSSIIELFRKWDAKERAKAKEYKQAKNVVSHADDNKKKME